MATKDIALILTFTDKGTPVVKKVVKGVTKELNKLEKKALSAGKGFKKFEKDVVSSTKGMSRLSKIMKSTAMQMAAGMGVMMGVQGAMRLVSRSISSTVKEGLLFGKAWANVTTMLSVSRKETLHLRAELKGLSPVLGSTTELARGMYQVLSASVEPAKAIMFLGEAAKSAKAGVTDAFTAVDALTTVINAYGMAAEEVTLVSDIMFQTVKMGKLTYEGMAGALGTIVPIAAQVGIGFADIGAAMATLTKQGIDVNTATVQMRQVMVSVLKPTAEAEAMATKLGLAFNAQALRAKGLVAFLQDIKKAVAGDMEAMTALFGNVRALTGVMALAGDQADAFAEAQVRMGEAAGSTEEAFKKQMEALSFWTEAFGNAVKQIKISFIEGLTAPLREGIENSEDFEKKFTEKMQNAARSASLFASSFVEMIQGIGKAFTWLKTAAKNVDKFIFGGWDMWVKKTVEITDAMLKGIPIQETMTKHIEKLNKTLGEVDFENFVGPLSDSEKLFLANKEATAKFTGSLDELLKRRDEFLKGEGGVIIPVEFMTQKKRLKIPKLDIGAPDQTLADIMKYDEAIIKAREADKANQGLGVALEAIQGFAIGTGLTIEQLTEGYKLNAEAAEKAAKAEAWEKRKEGLESFAEKVREIGAVVMQVVGGMNTIFAQFFANQMQRIDNEYQARKEAIDAGMMSDQEKYFAIEKLDREMEKKRLAAQRKQAVMTKATSVLGATVNTAEAVTKALASAFPPLNYILAATVGALGAAQVALIAAQPLPAYGEGGIAGLHGPEVIMVGEKGPERITPLSKEGVTANIEFNAIFEITALEPLAVRDVVRERVGPEFIEWVRLNKTDLLEALELV